MRQDQALPYTVQLVLRRRALRYRKEGMIVDKVSTDFFYLVENDILIVMIGCKRAYTTFFCSACFVTLVCCIVRIWQTCATYLLIILAVRAFAYIHG